ncbi:hypothetical protein DXG01_013076 [Tephrocybe rancida]|nr:hypothetical protein DXG01_013076 [Tephrocybe rancida]
MPQIGEDVHEDADFESDTSGFESDSSDDSDSTVVPIRGPITLLHFSPCKSSTTSTSLPLVLPTSSDPSHSHAIQNALRLLQRSDQPTGRAFHGRVTSSAPDHPFYGFSGGEVAIVVDETAQAKYERELVASINNLHVEWPMEEVVAPVPYTPPWQLPLEAPAQYPPSYVASRDAFQAFVYAESLRLYHASINQSPVNPVTQQRLSQLTNAMRTDLCSRATTSIGSSSFISHIPGQAGGPDTTIMLPINCNPHALQDCAVSGQGQR